MQSVHCKRQLARTRRKAGTELATRPTVTIAGASDGSRGSSSPRPKTDACRAFAWSGPFFVKGDIRSAPLPSRWVRLVALDSLVAIGCWGVVWCDTKSWVGGIRHLGSRAVLELLDSDDYFASHYRPNVLLGIGQLRAPGRCRSVAKLRAGCLPKLLPSGSSMDGHDVMADEPTCRCTRLRAVRQAHGWRQLSTVKRIDREIGTAVQSDWRASASDPEKRRASPDAIRIGSWSHPRNASGPRQRPAVSCSSYSSPRSKGTRGVKQHSQTPCSSRCS
jgi:hypothetical protein